jgi:cupin 2 domain-containing protein
MDNLFEEIPVHLPEELLQTLLRTHAIRIERIVSRGHTTPTGQWYDQPQSEFVLLLQGAARLAFDDGAEVAMGPGDWLEIPAHRKHRVAWTEPEQDSVWLAVHFD